MKKSIFLGFMLMGMMAFAQDSVSSKSYLSLRNLSLDQTASNNLLFYCRPINEDEKTLDHLDWQSGILLSTTNDTFSITARHDPNTDLIELQLNNHFYQLFNQKTQAILIGDKVFINGQLKKEDQSYFSYFELICEGSFDLLRKDEKYYIQLPDQSIQKIGHSKKQFIHHFTPYQEEVRNFLKEERLRITRKSDLIQILQFVNSNFDFKVQID